MSYTILQPHGVVVRDLDGKQVAPCQDPNDPDFRAYQAWAEEGNLPAYRNENSMALKPRIIVSAWQIRKALNAAGLRTQVENAVAASTDMELRDGWEYSPNFYSDNPLALAMGQALGKTADEMYGLFQLAEML